jgi:hypothetical protein
MLITILGQEFICPARGSATMDVIAASRNYIDKIVTNKALRKGGPLFLYLCGVFVLS